MSNFVIGIFFLIFVSLFITVGVLVHGIIFGCKCSEDGFDS